MSENIKESSLTSPEDRISTRESPWRPDSNAPELTDEETNRAMNFLNNNEMYKNYPKVERSYLDPPPLNQNIGLISFIPAKGSSPNKNGVYGYAKLRGNFATELEANKRAEFLIRNVDSYHNIYHTFVGRPFPLTTSSNFSAEVEEIDIRKDMSESISDDIKNKKREEKKIIEDIKDREEKLLSESKKAVKDEVVYDSYENYITLKVKKAQLTWTYLEHQKKMKEIVDILVKTRKEIEELDDSYPEYKDKYYDKYMEARESAGLEHSKETETNFVRYMVEDVVIPEVEKLYKEKYTTSV
jgi:hypothetical protein